MAKWISGNRYLSMPEMQENATYIWESMSEEGWTMNAVAGMLGNMQTESTINPGIWQNLDEGNLKLGFGLVQWTPATNYIDWATAEGWDIGDMDGNLARINYEYDRKIQYYPTKQYPLTWTQFKNSTDDPYMLGMAFLYNYERPGDLNQPKRGTQAQYWFNFLGGIPPKPPKRKGMPVFMMLRRF